MFVLVIFDYSGLFYKLCSFMIFESLNSDLLAFNIEVCML